MITIFFTSILILHYVIAVNSVASGKDLNVRHEQSVLETSTKELEKTRTKTKRHLLYTLHDVTRREERASTLALTGGSPGE